MTRARRLFAVRPGLYGLRTPCYAGIGMARQPATVTIDIERCKGCVLCVDVCPPRVLVMTEHEVNHMGYRYPLLLDGCTGCELCFRICPDFCFEVYRGAEEAAGAP